jgi:hypothetical protein
LAFQYVLAPHQHAAAKRASSKSETKAPRKLFSAFNALNTKESSDERKHAATAGKPAR